ncbi:hypothetical protein CPAST_c16990 [Clostridium pasteurianum DSM 525 = ATCC 6013]|uniref:Bacterial membrane protein YfhO n=1 Tax=Clostridium pasteurianum DSM 525 = ATCC 6013 TaxID=1262449 RepID=A0A0H3J2T6_CLOPA|nr:YfhO family protein [Clostridium pasteurianum]AJA47769.1 hypothetical protein CPAST_c16990 [Clostridium pasteurianum DSM 525 = ATCC 6013]AJA51757.1 hypothetical protein CLPA_c16990 [Clostridium pasteurianum DSM 525 = ATCC 6013]AOZ75066.1 hypothetical protein AQ983_08220 [Clostridium pasteurianum DSM 525 = ATCC 6013]AOZ78861.1 hypothetical protein AQ984_08210 [Clostridium pasteurianum]ELP59670.1 hypothetical protein F502_07393 [Clostridium pasteurianum DSM 525 = ATCC 6013]
MEKVCGFFKRNLYIIAAFILPFIILTLVYIKMDMSPFGGKSILISDMKGQYVHFFSSYRDILLQGKSLLYSWNAGMGLSLIGLIAYYLSSPITFILLIIPKEYLTDGILLMIMIKISLSGSTFAAYIKYKFKRNDISILIFSLFYALMSYSIVYSYNLMWLDGVFLLPIVLIGVEKVIRENKYIFLIITYILLFISNFYIGYMDALFSFIYFIAIYFIENVKFSFRDFFKKLYMYILSSILAIGCTAFIMIPTYYSLKAGESPFMNNLPGLGINFNIFDLFSKLLIGSYDRPTDGLPNIFCGLLVILILPLFYVNFKIKLKEKFIYTALFLIMLISMENSLINVVWHAFHIPNCFPYRYSFLTSFIMILISYRVYMNFKYIKLSQLFKSYIFIGFIVVIIQKFGYNYLDVKSYYLTFIFLTIYFLIFAFKINYSKKYSKIITLILILTVFCEMFASSLMLYNSVNRMLGFSDKKDYINYVKNYKPIFEDVQNKDKTFYRMEKNFSMTHNDPLSLEYNGIASFTSTANQGLNNTLNSLGFYGAASSQEMEYKGATIVTDSIFGIKYIVSQDNINNYYKEYKKYHNAAVYENSFALPIGFMVSDSVYSVNFSNNFFENQNEVLNKMVGNKDKVSYFNRIKNVNIKLNNVSISKENGMEIYTKINPNIEGSIEYSFNSEKDYPIYMYLNGIQNGELAQVYLDNKLLDNNYIHYYYKSYILEADNSYKESNKSKIVKIVLKNNRLPLKDSLFYYLDMNNTEKALGELNNNSFNIKEYGENLIKGNINVTNKKVLYTSIPYDSGWSVKVDGKKADIKKSLNAFISVELQEGSHEIAFEFLPKGFKAGVLISLISIFIFIAVILLRHIKKRKIFIRR